MRDLGSVVETVAEQLAWRVDFSDPSARTIELACHKGGLHFLASINRNTDKKHYRAQLKLNKANVEPMLIKGSLTTINLTGGNEINITNHDWNYNYPAKQMDDRLRFASALNQFILTWEFSDELTKALKSGESGMCLLFLFDLNVMPLRNLAETASAPPKYESLS